MNSLKVIDELAKGYIAIHQNEPEELKEAMLSSFVCGLCCMATSDTEFKNDSEKIEFGISCAKYLENRLQEIKTNLQRN